MKPISADRFLDAFRAGASATEMDILLSVLKRDYQAMREAEALCHEARQILTRIATEGVTPHTLLKLRRASTAISEVRK